MRDVIEVSRHATLPLAAVLVVDQDATNPRDDYEHLGTFAVRDRTRRIGGKGDDHGNAHPRETLAELLALVDARAAEVLGERFERLMDRPWREYGISDDRRFRAEESLEAAYEAALLELVRRHYVVLPVYVGSYGAVSCGSPEDSTGGADGVIYCSLSDARKEWPGLDDAALVARVAEALTGEVEEYSDWASGEVYGVIVYDVSALDEGDDVEEGEELDSCYGFIGRDYAEEEMQRMLDEAAAAR